MSDSLLLPCDGCGQLADSAHISRRLERLAWSTRFRPLHIQALLLSAIAPKRDSDFLYSPSETFHGEAATILNAVPLPTEGRSAKTVLTEFQKLGLMLAHILECPLDESVSESQAKPLPEKQLAATIARIRRSFKPKRLLLVSGTLLQQSARFHQADLGCVVLPTSTGAFLTSLTPSESELQAFRAALAISNAHAI
jgi:hypothetical protein